MSYWVGIPELKFGGDRSLDHNRTNGKYRVVYPDGLVSQLLFHDVASDYARIFGGRVITKAEGDALIAQARKAREGL